MYNQSKRKLQNKKKRTEIEEGNIRQIEKQGGIFRNKVFDVLFISIILQTLYM
jgi:predicted rRNA methylase YqxC with S4 and FtsJ domains